MLASGCIFSFNYTLHNGRTYKQTETRVNQIETTLLLTSLSLSLSLFSNFFSLSLPQLHGLCLASYLALLLAIAMSVKALLFFFFFFQHEKESSSSFPTKPAGFLLSLLASYIQPLSQPQTRQAGRQAGRTAGCQPAILLQLSHTHVRMYVHREKRKREERMNTYM